MSARAAFAIVIIVITSIAVSISHERTPRFIIVNYDIKNRSEVLQYWEDHVKKVGPERAYKDFADTVKYMPLLEQHMTAHIFGASLYRAAGLAGIHICDDRFAQGCWHSFFGMAFKEHGNEAIDAVRSLCGTMSDNSQRRTCEHGFGHGMLGFSGYDVKTLDKVLGICKSVDTNDAILGCQSGALMEYMSYSLDVDSTKSRTLSSDGTYGPCLELSAPYRASCFFYLPTWWLSIFVHSSDAIEASRKTGVLCENAGEIDPSYSTLCLKGAGYTIPRMVYQDPEKTARACAAISARGAGRITCSSYAISQVDSKNSAYKSLLCQGLSAEDAAYCAAHAGDQVELTKPLNPTL